MAPKFNKNKMEYSVCGTSKPCLSGAQFSVSASGGELLERIIIIFGFFGGWGGLIVQFIHPLLLCGEPQFKAQPFTVILLLTFK